MSEVINEQSLIRILKLPKLPDGFQAHLGRIYSVIKEASFETLNKYLVHYNLEQCEVSEIIFTKLLEDFFKKFDAKKINLSGILDNLKQMQLGKGQLQKIIKSLTEKIIDNPS